jgi:hypothetical protein
VELIALVPAVVVIALLGWWVARTAHEWTLAGAAARAAVRAQEVGASPTDAARAVLGPQRGRAAVIEATVGRDGAPRAVVSLRPPGVLPGITAPAVHGRAATGAGAGAP